MTRPNDRQQIRRAFAAVEQGASVEDALEMARRLPVADHDFEIGDTVRTERGDGVIAALPYQQAWPEFIKVDLTDDGNTWNGERREFHWEDITRVAPGPRDRSFWTAP